ncbi:S46 family peptidase [Aquisphaera giovannonii]|uniref:S46 family peptidase n=1 Tax=Aquisphaera giovannonii TaxID=406548 RepID=UPI00143DB3A4|nr:S46 family peptidase [Aquisphaera giovannonii]
MHGLGDAASGFGDWARGTGSFLHDLALATSIQAETAIRVNQYQWGCYLETARRHREDLARRKWSRDCARLRIDERLLYHPEPRDIESGDAPNALIRYLSGPDVSPSALRALGLPMPRSTCDRLPFVLNRGGNLIIAPCRLRVGPRWPDLLRDPSFDRQRRSVELLVDDCLARATRGASLAAPSSALDRALAALRDRIDRRLAPEASPERAQARAFLDRLAASARMLHDPAATQVLRQLRSHPPATVAEAVVQMTRLHLQLPPAASPEEADLYGEFHRMLLEQRDRLVTARVAPAEAPAPVVSMAGRARRP